MREQACKHLVSSLSHSPLEVAAIDDPPHPRLHFAVIVARARAHLVFVLGEESTGAHLVDRGVELHDRLIIRCPIRARADGEGAPLVLTAHVLGDGGVALLSSGQVLQILRAHTPREMDNVHGKEGTGKPQDRVGGLRPRSSPPCSSACARAVRRGRTAPWT